MSDEDVDRKNYDEEEDIHKKTKEEIPNNLSFVKGVVDSGDLLPLNVNRETLQESNIIKDISKKLVMKAIDMLRKLAEKDESKKEKDDDIDNDTKEVDIHKKGYITETYNDKLVVNVTNDTPPPHYAMTITTAAASK